jgi:hypothetical protein
MSATYNRSCSSRIRTVCCNVLLFIPSASFSWTACGPTGFLGMLRERQRDLFFSFLSAYLDTLFLSIFTRP